jgi:hypothetical protein
LEHEGYTLLIVNRTVKIEGDYLETAEAMLKNVFRVI